MKKLEVAQLLLVSGLNKTSITYLNCSVLLFSSGQDVNVYTCTYAFYCHSNKNILLSYIHLAKKATIFASESNHLASLFGNFFTVSYFFQRIVNLSLWSLIPLY